VAPVGLLNILFGFVLPRLITRLGLRASITIATVSAGALIALVASQVSASRNVLTFALALLPMGMAFMATTVTPTLAATQGVANQEQGLAAGIRQTSFQLGIAVGVAVLVPIASSRAIGLGAPIGSAAYAHALAGGIQLALLILAALVVAAGLVALNGVRRPSAPSP